MINEFFDRILWLTTGRQDRGKNMQERLAKYPIAEKFQALTGGTPKAIEIIKADGLILKPHGSIRGRKQLNNGEIGCYLSHREMWKYIKSKGWNKVLILEDDALFVGADLFNVDKLPETWDMLYLGQHNYDSEFVVKTGSGKNAALQQHIDKTLFKASHCWLTHAYAVNAKCIDYLLESTKLMDWPIDGILSEAQDNLNVYAFYPDIIIQDNTKSSLR